MVRRLEIYYDWKTKMLHFKILHYLERQRLQHGYVSHTTLSNRNQLNARSNLYLNKDDTLFDFNPIINVHKRDTEIICKLTKLIMH